MNNVLLTIWLLAIGLLQEPAPDSVDPFESIRGQSIEDLQAIKSAVGDWVGKGQDVMPIVIQGLKDSDRFVQIVCIHSLKKWSDLRAVKPLSVFAEKEHSEVILRPALDALVSLDREAGVRSICKKLESRKQATRKLASALLEKVIEPQDWELIRSLVNHRHADTRSRAVRLLPKVEIKHGINVGLVALGDRDPKVAGAAVQAFSRMPGAEVDKILTQQVASGIFDRAWAYACLALATRWNKNSSIPWKAEMNRPLLMQLNQPDPFLSGSAAVLLATSGYFAPEHEEIDFLHREVPDVLVKTVAQKVFYRDFQSLFPHAQKALQLISGENDFQSGSEWAFWWLNQRDSFRANRQFEFFRRGKEEEVVIEWRRKNQPNDRILFYGRKTSPTIDQGFLVSRSDLQSLLEIFRTQSKDAVTQTEWPQNNVGGLKVSFPRQNRVYLWDHNEEMLGPIIIELERLQEDYEWQFFFDSNSFNNLREFQIAELGWWEKIQDPELRSIRLKNLIMKAFPHFSPKKKREALYWFSQDQVVKQLNSEDNQVLFNWWLTQQDSFLQESLLNILIQSGKVDWDQLDSQLNLLEVGIAIPLLEKIYLKMGPEELKEKAQSKEVKIKSAAIRAMASRGMSFDRSSIENLSSNPEPLVRAAASFVVGLRNKEEEWSIIEKLSVDDHPEIRSAVCEAAALFQTEEGYSLLLKMLGDPSPQVQEKAIHGLGAFPEQKSVGVMTELVFNKKEARLALLASDKLAQMLPTDVNPLWRHAKSQDREDRRKALILLSDLFVWEAIQPISQMLSERPQDSRLLDALQSLTTWEPRPSQRTVQHFRGWWNQHEKILPGNRFGRLAEKHGYSIGAISQNWTKEDYFMMGKMILDDSWVLRVQAGYWLRVGISRDISKIDRYTPKEQLERLSQDIPLLIENRMVEGSK